MTYMYENTITWNPFKGCKFNCVYCKNSFQRQAKRQKQNCLKCYHYEPHFHPERLNNIPKAELVFACGNGDIAFAKPMQKTEILKAMQLKPKQTFLLQTKDPICLWDYPISSNVIVGTTIETNREIRDISKAPDPSVRYHTMKGLSCRKAVTIEPILDFDLPVLKKWIEVLQPEIVWIGYANHTTGLELDEPELDKTYDLIHVLKQITDVRLKTMRERRNDSF